MTNCRVCYTASVGLPTPGYIHDVGCPKRQDVVRTIEQQYRVVRRRRQAVGTHALWSNVGGMIEVSPWLPRPIRTWVARD